MEDFETTTRDTTSKKFRVKTCDFLLTYKTHINKDEYRKYMFNRFADIQAKKGNANCMNFSDHFVHLRLGHEKGSNTDTPYEHTHVVMILKRPLETTNPRWFDYEGIHPHIATIKKKNQIPYALKYIAKEDPENEDLLKAEYEDIYRNAKDSFVDEIQSFETLNEAFKNYITSEDKLKNVVPIKILWESRKTHNEGIECIEEDDIPTSKWQLDFMEEFKNRPVGDEKRKTIWFYDKYGKSGKSDLTNYLEAVYPKLWLSTEDLGTSRDAAIYMKQEVAKGWQGHGIIIDLPRTCEHHSRMYAYIESIKNGRMSSTKYSGARVRFKKPWMIIFANWMPKMWNLSPDRWDVRIIEKDSDGISYIKKYTPKPEDFINPDIATESEFESRRRRHRIDFD